RRGPNSERKRRSGGLVAAVHGWPGTTRQGFLLPGRAPPEPTPSEPTPKGPRPSSRVLRAGSCEQGPSSAAFRVGPFESNLRFERSAPLRLRADSGVANAGRRPSGGPRRWAARGTPRSDRRRRAALGWDPRAPWRASRPRPRARDVATERARLRGAPPEVVDC